MLSVTATRGWLRAKLQPHPPASHWKAKHEADERSQPQKAVMKAKDESKGNGPSGEKEGGPCGSCGIIHILAMLSFTSQF